MNFYSVLICIQGALSPELEEEWGQCSDSQLLLSLVATRRKAVMLVCPQPQQSLQVVLWMKLTFLAFCVWCSVEGEMFLWQDTVLLPCLLQLWHKECIINHVPHCTFPCRSFIDDFRFQWCISQHTVPTVYLLLLYKCSQLHLYSSAALSVFTNKYSWISHSDTVLCYFLTDYVNDQFISSLISHRNLLFSIESSLALEILTVLERFFWGGPALLVALGSPSARVTTQ